MERRARSMLATWALCAVALAVGVLFALDCVWGSSAVGATRVAVAQSTRWLWPTGTPAQVLARFDAPARPWLAGHRGVDLAVRLGSPIRTAGAGTVTYVGVIAGRGIVTVTHGELRTTYEPLDATVGVGSQVAAGEQIGTIGAGGHCDGRCLHWGLLRGEVYLDPLLLLAQSPPVLKPLRAPNTPASNTGSPVQQTGESAALAATSRSSNNTAGHNTADRAPPALIAAAAGGSAAVVAVGAAVMGKRRRRPARR